MTTSPCTSCEKGTEVPSPRHRRQLRYSVVALALSILVMAMTVFGLYVQRQEQMHDVDSHIRELACFVADDIPPHKSAVMDKIRVKYHCGPYRPHARLSAAQEAK